MTETATNLNRRDTMLEEILSYLSALPRNSQSCSQAATNSRGRSADILVRSKLDRILGQEIRRALVAVGVAADKNVRAPAFDCGWAALRPSPRCDSIGSAVLNFGLLSDFGLRTSDFN